MFKKFILFILFGIYFFSLNSKGNVLFTNCSGFEIEMRVSLNEYEKNSDRCESVYHMVNRLEIKERLVINFMRYSSHDLFYEKIAFQIRNDFYIWGLFYLENFNLNFDYKFFINGKDLWFMGYNDEGVFVTDTCKGIFRWASC